MTIAVRWSFLYRHFDQEGALLYIGISDALTARSSDHMSGSPWARFVHRVVVEPDGYESRAAALAAERLAIGIERPIFNKQHSTVPSSVVMAYLQRYQAVDLLESLFPLAARARAVGIEDGQWPNDTLYNNSKAQLDMVQWAEAHNVYQFNYPPVVCLCWLTRGPLDVYHTCDNHREVYGTWCDHLSGWMRGGKPAVLVCQPYGIYPDELSEIMGLAQRYGFGVHIDGTGWYGHGTTLIELWRVPEMRDWHGKLRSSASMYHQSRNDVETY